MHTLDDTTPPSKENARLETQLGQEKKIEFAVQLVEYVTHDLNNLLQLINGYAEVALDI